MTNPRDISLYKTAITRFTNETWEENLRWKEKANMTSRYIYNTLSPIPVSLDGIPNVFMVEMNISTKQIIGVGLVKNRCCLAPYRVYKNNIYNYYSYLTKYHMNREEFTEKELEKIRELELCLFTGFGHLIRGAGISRLPEPLRHIGGRGKGRIVTEFDTKYDILFYHAFARKYRKTE